jgi:hypothetical protein
MSDPMPSASSLRTPLEAGKRDRRWTETTLAAKEVVGLGTALKGEHKKATNSNLINWVAGNHVQLVAGSKS